MLESFHAILKGKVQGVGFRYFVLTRARALGLHGFTRNLEDGSVEVYAEGERASLEEFERLLAQGPEPARVDEMQARYGEARRRVVGFYVR
jgi:acylphosphatase